MRKKTLKNIALFAAAGIAALSLSGCAGQTASKKAVEYRGSKVVLNGDKIYPVQCEDTLTYYKYDHASWSHSYKNLADTPLGQEIERKTGIKVIYQHPFGNGDENFQLMLASGDLPDIVQYSWNNYSGGPDASINEEYIYELNDIIEKFAPAFSKTLASNEKWDKQCKTDTGKYFAFPMLLNEGVAQHTYGPTVRADWLRELGLESPVTLDQWENTLMQFKEKKGLDAPFTGNLVAMIKTFGPPLGVYRGWYKNGDTVVYGAAQPEYRDLLTLLNDWYNRGLIDHDFSVANFNEIEKKMINGDSGATSSYNGGGIAVWLNANKDNKNYDIAGLQYPAKEVGQKAEYGDLTSPVVMAQGAAISTTCKNPELAARFLDYGFTDEGHLLYNFGIEGESYNMVDGYPKYTDLIMKNPSGLSISFAMGPYMFASNSTGIMVSDERYMEQFYTDPRQRDAQKAWANSNMSEHALPQMYLKTEETQNDSTIMANVSTYVDEMSIKFITGKEPLSKFDEYIKQLEAFGLKDAISYRQSALERYNNR